MTNAGGEFAGSSYTRPLPRGHTTFAQLHLQDGCTHLRLGPLLEGLQRHLLPGQHQRAAGQPARERPGHHVLAQPDPGMLPSACAVALMEAPSHHLMEGFGCHLTPHPEAATACVVR